MGRGAAAKALVGVAVWVEVLVERVAVDWARVEMARVVTRGEGTAEEAMVVGVATAAPLEAVARRAELAVAAGALAGEVPQVAWAVAAKALAAWEAWAALPAGGAASVAQAVAEVQVQRAP